MILFHSFFFPIKKLFNVLCLNELIINVQRTKNDLGIFNKEKKLKPDKKFFLLKVRFSYKYEFENN